MLGRASNAVGVVGPVLARANTVSGHGDRVSALGEVSSTLTERVPSALSFASFAPNARAQCGLVIGLIGEPGCFGIVGGLGSRPKVSVRDGTRDRRGEFLGEEIGEM
jgi:hypothetical protein